jgi:hypothetical protein
MTEAKRRLGLVGVALVFAGVFALAVQVHAHHSFAATYFEDKTETIEGNLVQFVFRNPHSYVHVEAPDEKGETARWAIEWASGQSLAGQGISRETLKAGDHVVVTGAPGRNADDHRMRMHSIERPKDGWKWSGNFQ